jgi:hypothetical protein
MSTLQIRRLESFSHFGFIILFVSILSSYVINFDDASLFVNLSFTFLAMLNDVLYQFYWMNIILFLSKEKESHNNIFKTKLLLIIFPFLTRELKVWSKVDKFPATQVSRQTTWIPNNTHVKLHLVNKCSSASEIFSHQTQHKAQFLSKTLIIPKLLFFCNRVNSILGKISL